MSRVSGTILAMPHFKAQVTLAMASNIPEDNVVNTFHFESSDPAFMAATVPVALKDAYQIIRPMLPVTVKQNGHSIKVYSMAQPEPRVPIYDGTFNFTTAPSGDPMPPEVALCCSFQAARISGDDQRNRRGRVYLGPHRKNGLETDGRPHPDVISQAAAFGQFLLDASDGWANTKWVVYSPTNGTMANVVNGWVDNAWDTQRRRGIRPTARTLFS